MDDLFTQGLEESFTQAALTQALRQVRDLEATVGMSLAEVEAKRVANARLEQALAPFKIVAAAWAGGVMLGSPNCDDEAYARLVTGRGPNRRPTSLEAEPGLQPMIARGLGVDMADAIGSTWREILASGRRHPRPALRISFSRGLLSTRGCYPAPSGFDAVLGNPPWDRMLPADKEFFASYDFGILDAPTKRERTAKEQTAFSRFLAPRACTIILRDFVGPNVYW